MREIRIHGRGGQGAVTSSQVLAIAAFHDGKYSQAFPMFGVERRGAPVQSFARISNSEIHIRQQVYEPDYVIVLDSSLLQGIDVAAGLKPNGAMIINTDKAIDELKGCGAFHVQELKKKGASVHAINVTEVALSVIGKPFVNIAALGAFAALTEEVSIGALKNAIDEAMGRKGKAAELNKLACEKLYNQNLGKQKSIVAKGVVAAHANAEKKSGKKQASTAAEGGSFSVGY